MKVYRVLFLLLALFSFSWLQAGVVTEEQALEGNEGAEFQENVDNGLSMWFTVTNNGEVKVGRLTGGQAVDKDLFKGIDGNAPERTSITIPGTVIHEGTTYTITAIGDNAFANLEQLLAVEIPATVTSIGDNAFRSWNLSKVILKSKTPFELTSQYSFSDYTKDQGILYVENKVDIETYKTNWKFNHVFVTGGIEFMDATVAEYCINNWGGDDGILTETEAKAVTSDMMFPSGTSPFAGNYIISFDELQYFGITSIPKQAFMGCGMRSVKIPEGVTTIGDEAFMSNEFETIDFPNSLTKMGRNVLLNNRNLSTITGGNQIITTENGLYYGRITEFRDGEDEEEIMPKLSLIRVGVNTSGKVSIKEGTEKIEQGAFLNCSKVTAVTLPKSLNNIEGDFEDCPSLATIEVAEGNEFFMADDNVLYATWGSNTLQQLILCGRQNTVVTIPESVRSINGRAFADCSNVISVILPSSLSYIGWAAFENCTSLAEITLPANVSEISGQAFLNCKNLKNVYSRIKNVANVFLAENAFLDRDENWNDSKRDATLWVPTGYVDLYKEKGWNNYFTAIKEDASLDGLTVGDLFVFQDGDNSVKLKYKITSIGETVNTCEVSGEINSSAIVERPESFDNNLTIPEVVEDENGKKYQVTGIGDHALEECGLISVTLPSGLTYIGEGALAGNSNMTSIELPASLTRMSRGALDNWELMQVTANMEMPAQIEERTFSDNTYNNGSLVVPVGTKSAYKADDFWKRFNNIYSGNEGTEFTAKGENDFEILFTITGENTVKVGSKVSQDENQAVDRVLFNGDDNTRPTQTAIIIPETVEYNNKTYTVTEIGNYAFRGIGFKTISLPSTLTKIGTWVFVDNWNVKELVIPKSVTEISEGAILNCGNLTTLTVADGGNDKYTSVNNAIIEYGTKIIIGTKTTVIPDDVIAIGARAFESVSNMNLTIPQKVTTIGEYAFAWCDNCIIKVEYETPIAINENTFEEASRNHCVLKVPTGTKAAYQTATGWKAFGENILEGDMGTEFKAQVGGNAFDMTFTITGENTVKVGSLTANWDIPAVDRILFNGDENTQPSQTAIVVPENVEYKGKTYTVTEIGDLAFCEVQFATITLPSTLLKISREAIAYNWNVRELRIPNSVTEISESSIYGCGNLTLLKVEDGDNTKYTSPNNNVIIENGTKIIVGTRTTIIPDGVTRIGENAFLNASDMNLTIPLTVATIGEQAFAYCRNCVFTVKYETPITINENTFWDSPRNNCVLIVPKKKKSDYLAKEGWNKFPESSIMERDFEHVFSALTVEGVDVVYSIIDANTVQVGEGIAGSPTISNTTVAVTIPEKVNGYTVVSIGDYAFQNTQSLREVVIPTSVTSIGKYAFDTSGLSEVSIPSSVTSIGEMAFNLNARLMKIIVNMPTPVAINDNVFSNDDANVNTYGRATLVVPAGMIDTYKAVSGWSKFETVTDALPQEFKKVVNDVEMVFTITGDNTVQVGYQTDNHTGNWEKRAIPNSDDRDRIGNRDLTIPSTVSYNYQDYTVTAIGDYAFNCMGMKTITLPSTIQSIGEFAFWSANLMRSFELPSGVVSIGARALGANLLTSLTVATGNKKYSSPEGSNAIIDADKLVVGIASTVIPASVTTIGSFAFTSQEGLVLTILQTITAIENFAFEGSNGVITVGWPTPPEIGENAFSNIQSSMVLRVPSGSKDKYVNASGWNKFDPNNIKEGYDGAVFKANTIEGVEMTFMVIDANAMTAQVGVGGFGNGARAIEQDTKGTLTIPETVNGYTVVALADYSLRNCYNLTSISIPKTVVNIGEEGLANCYRVTEFMVDAENPSFCAVDGTMFTKDMKTLLYYPAMSNRTEYSVPDGVETLGAYAFEQSQNLKTVTLPEGLKKIEECAFMDCYYIESINIPASLETLGNQAFGYCNGMLNYNVAEGNTHFSSLDGVLFNADQTKLIQYPGGKTGSYVIPNSVTSIGASAFGTVSLSELTIPNSVREFGGFAFTNCHNMTVIRSLIEDPDDISETVFSGIGYKTILYVPKGLKNKYLSYKNWDQIPCLMEDTGVTYEVLNDQVVVTAADNQKADGNFNIQADLIVNNEEMAVTAIADKAFEGATNMKTMMLPASIQTIGSEAFKGCSQLKQIINMNPNPISLSTAQARSMSKSGTRSAVASQFEGISSDCILYVPAVSKTLYDSDPQWSGSFKEIVGIAGMGDANHDERISQKDAVDVIDYLLTNDPDKILFGVSDMNGDDAITVTDLVKIIEASQGHAGSREQK